MASDNATSTWDIPGAKYVPKSPPVTGKMEILHQGTTEDDNPSRVKTKLHEDTPPQSEPSSTVKNSLEISAALQRPNNLFEILIQRVESANDSTAEDHPLNTDNTKDHQTMNTTAFTEPNINGNGYYTNGDASSDFDEADIKNPKRASPHRSIFDHLRKNFRMPDENRRGTTDESSVKSEPLAIRPTEKEVTSSGESYNSSDISHELDQNDADDFPFTKRLKWISQRSREGSPSFPQQQPIPTEVVQEVMDNNNLVSSSHDIETSKKTGGVSTDATRTSVITSSLTTNNPKQVGFQPLLNSNQSRTSDTGSVSLRLHNGKTEVMRDSVGVQTMEKVRIPTSEVFLLMDPNPSRVLELNRDVTSINIHGNNRSEKNRSLVPEPGNFHVLSENHQPVYSVVRNPSSPAGNSFVGGVSKTIEKNFINLNEPNVPIANNEQRMCVSRAPIQQATVDLSSTVYTKSPIHSNAFSPIWDQRSVVTSSIPISHRIPASVSHCYGNGLSTVSSFGRPTVYHPRSLGNPVVYGAQNQICRPVQLQARQEIHFTSRFYHSAGLTAVPNVGQNLRLPHNEYITKSPPPYSVNERVFRPVSPQWPQVLYTNNVCSGVNSFAQVTKNEPTISEEDRDEFSYACALHESANSPDIERMLGSESPDENICTENFSSTNQSASRKELKYLICKSSDERSPSQERSTHSGTARTATSPTESSTRTNSLTSPWLIKEVRKESKEVLESRMKRNHEGFCKNDQKSNKNSINEHQQKRALNLNVIHKRLQPKLPSPERETSSGDLYRDPSKLTREERALQRAMMQFSEMESKAMVMPPLPKKTRLKKKQANTDDTEKPEPQPFERKGKLASSTWLLKVKKKQRKWISNRSKFTKNSSDSIIQTSEEYPDVKVKPQMLVDYNEMEEKEDIMKTKIRKRKRHDDQNHENASKKHRKFMKERKRNRSREVFKETLIDSKDAGGQNLEFPKEHPKKERKKVKKFSDKRREQHRGDVTMRKEVTSDHAIDTDTRINLETNMLPPKANKRQGLTADAVERSHRVKTYMLVPSYQGFKDFQPVVMTSRTRNKRMGQSEETGKTNVKPKVPLLVVESVRSKPVKEMVVAENEEVQRLVTECLRVHGKWHGDELEQALKREEAKLNDEESKMRDAKRLTVNRTTGETILHKAARLGYDEVVKQCILRGADPNARDNAGWTPLHEACARGKLSVVKVLARYGANVDAPSNDGIRPIHDAAEAGHVDIIRVLLSYGADPMLATYGGNNALACAKETKTKKFLRDYSTDVGFEGPSDREDDMGGWEFTCSSRLQDNPERSDHVSGIWEDIPDCSDSFVPEFEVSDRPHLPTYNLPVLKNGKVVGRRNYLLLREVYESGFVAKSTLQKKLKNVETREMPWSEFLDILEENHLCVKPSYSPEGSSKDEPKAELIPLNYSIRKLLGLRIEVCR